MTRVVGIKFKSPKIYYFAADSFEYTLGGGVIAETARGLEYGTVAMLPFDIEDEKIVQPLKPVLRIANAEDDKQHGLMLSKRGEAMRVTNEKISSSKLQMKLVDAEYTFDGTKLIIYFTADGRVDFRELVKELAAAFHVRIELRQIGARDECRIKGGIAPCGRACCCSDHMADFAHVTIKMAKNQSLSLNPAKISGLCGRLMCCLAYENAHYSLINKKMPRMGSVVTTSDGRQGVVIGLNQLKEHVRLKLGDDDNIEIEDFDLHNISFKGKTLSDDTSNEDRLDDELKELID